MLLAAAATVAVSLVLLFRPDIDLAVSRLFFVDGRFPAAADGLLQAGRLAGRIVTRLAVAAIAIGILVRIFAPARLRGFDSRVILFLAGSMALAPGLLVNLVLKQHWGRPRPQDTDAFGGAWPFGLPWDPRGGCTADCSFPSAEASAAIWLVAFAFVVPRPCRRGVAAAALVWTALISLNRIAFGGHYLSDVLVAWGLTLTVVLAARAVVLDGMTDGRRDRVDAGLAALGRRLRPGARSL